MPQAIHDHPQPYKVQLRHTNTQTALALVTALRDHMVDEVTLPTPPANDAGHAMGCWPLPRWNKLSTPERTCYVVPLTPIPDPAEVSA